MKQQSLQSRNISTPLPQTKVVCKSKSCKVKACSDTKAVDCIMAPINVKIEPDTDQYFLSLKIPLKESAVHPEDHKVELDVLESEIKLEQSKENHLSFEAAEMKVDPFRDVVNCIKPDNEDADDLEESLCAVQGNGLQQPTPQLKKDPSNNGVLVLTEPEGLSQDGRVCHLLGYRTEMNKGLEKQQHNENKSRKRTNHENISKTKQGKVKKNTCSLCGKIFATCSGLRIHMRIHTGEKPYSCPTCDKAFSRSDFLKDHMRIHSGQPKPAKPFRYPCSQCDKTFAEAHGLRYHMRRHSRERPYLCHLCDKRFIDISDLNQHAMCHTNIRPFVCTQCGNSFQRRGTLEKHQRIHTGERPYECPECGKALRYKYSLSMHMKTHRK